VLAIATRPVVIPGGKEAPGEGKAGLPELFLRAQPLAMSGEVSGQVRPADLALLRVKVIVGPPPVAGGDAGKALRKQGLGLALVAVGGDAKDGGPPGESAPQGALAAAGAPAGLIDVDRRGGADVVEQLRRQ
jgi:hypothetical protein